MPNDPTGDQLMYMCLLTSGEVWQVPSNPTGSNGCIYLQLRHAYPPSGNAQGHHRKCHGGLVAEQSVAQASWHMYHGQQCLYLLETNHSKFSLGCKREASNFRLLGPGIPGPARHALFHNNAVNSHTLLRFYDLPVNADIDQVLHRFTYCAKEWARSHHQDRRYIGFRV